MTEKFDGIIFDLDGTLWDSVTAVTNSWNSAIAEYPQVDKHLVESDISGIMGLVIEEIGERFFPSIPADTRMKIMDRCCEIECDYLAKNGGKLYEGVEETLEKLSKTHKLFIVSNCQNGYMEAFFEYHKLDKYFTDTEHSGATGLCKGENIKLVMQRNNIKSAIYLGDAQGDCDASIMAEIPFIFAKYGFGQVKEYDYKIDDIRELVELLG